MTIRAVDRHRLPIGDQLGTPPRAGRFLLTVAKLRPGVSRAGAQREMDVITRRLAAEYPDDNTGGDVPDRGVAAVACYLPARRATRVDPVVALRAD